MSEKQRKKHSPTHHDNKSSVDYMFEEPNEEMYKQAFKAFDRDGDGKIDASEIQAVEKVLGQNPSNSDVKRFIRRTDRDSDGGINFEEFKKSIKSTLSSSTSHSSQNYFTKLLFAFKYFDTDKDGFLTVDELRQICAELGDDRLQEAEVHAFLQIADKDNNHKLDVGELIAALEQYQYTSTGGQNYSYSSQ